MSPTVDKASCNENRGDSLLNLWTQAVVVQLLGWGIAVLMPLCRALRSGQELAGPEKSTKTMPANVHTERKNGYLRCRGNVETACQVIQSAFLHYFSCTTIQKRFGL